MTSTFVNSNGLDYSPIVVSTLTWNRNPNSVSHAVLSAPANGSSVTQVGESSMTGHFDIVCENGAEADALAEAAVYGVQFNDDDSSLSGIVVKATGAISVVQDADTKVVFVVSFDWVQLS